MHVKLLLLINAVIYCILLFNEHAICSRLTLLNDICKQESEIKDIAELLDSDNINSSNIYIFKKRSIFDLCWFITHNFQIDRNGVLYYPIGKIKFFQNPRKHISNDAFIDNSEAVSNKPMSALDPRANATTPDPSYTRNDTTTASSPAVNNNESRIRRLNGTIAGIKCIEYAKELLMRSTCSTGNLRTAEGNIIESHTYAHMASLGKYEADGLFKHLCSGSLISGTWILTAAHCVGTPNSSPTIARLGTYDLKDQNSGVTVPIKRMIRHPTYKPPTLYADIALLELERSVAFSASIRSACLHQRYDDFPLHAWVSGWGASERDGEATGKLQYASLNIVDTLYCSLHYNMSEILPYGVTPKMICVQKLASLRTNDACPGDTGGPLQIISITKHCMHIAEIMGVMSFGKLCTSVEKPAIYIRISHYLDWIEGTVWPNESRRFVSKRRNTYNLHSPNF